MDWRAESEAFDRTADYYDLFRPGYPAEIIDDMIRTTGIGRDAKVLEIGPGSGKATGQLAPMGFEILGVELGERLAEAGARRFQDHPNVQFVVGRFEEFELPPQSFDLVFSAQAFHWIPQPAGYQKCARVLKDGGFLALVWNMYMTNDSPLDRELLELSQRYGGFADFLSEDDCEKRIASIVAGIENSGLFGNVQVRRVRWSQSYSADEYCGFVQTGNSFVQKPEEEKQRAFGDIRKLAERHGGVIVRPYLCVSYLAPKRPL